MATTLNEPSMSNLDAKNNWDDKEILKEPTSAKRRISRTTSAPAVPSLHSTEDNSSLDEASINELDRDEVYLKHVFYFHKRPWRVRRCYILILMTSLTYMTIGLNDSAVGALIPQMQEFYNHSEATMSLCFLANFGGYLVSTAISSYLIHHLPLRIVLMIASAIYAAGSLIGAFAPPFATIVVSLLLTGAGGGLLDVAATSVIIHYEDGPLLTITYSFFSVGSMVSPFIVGGLRSSGKAWNLYFWFPVALSLFLMTLQCPGSSDESNPDEKKSKGRVLRRKSKSYSSLNPSKQTKSPPSQPKLKLKQATRQQSESSDEELKPPPLPPKPAKIPLGARHKRVPAIIKIPGRDVEFAHSRNGSTASEAQTTASSATTTTTFQTETTATTAPSSLILDTPVLSSKKASLKDRESLASRITYQQSPETTPIPAKVDTTPIATEAPAISLNTSDNTLMRSPSSSNTIALNRARSKAMRDRAKRLSLAKSSNNLLQVASNQSLTKSLHQSQSCSTFKSATTSTSRQTFESAFDGTNPADYSPSPTWEYDDIYNSNSNLRQTEENENTRGLLPLQPINEVVSPLVDYDLNWFMQHSASYKSIKLAGTGGAPSESPSIPQAMHHNDTVTKRNVSNSHSVTDQNELEDLDDSVKQALLMADDVLAFS
ncbi:hypothetical protein E3Q22_02752 [Wallemia mellicola]|uniref:MFS general substrate transporter n=1 Tax=Wallemia mellicola TaxID=1708541 RepID=A0A4T0QER4_9BASI|nr:hypothetical protein E3Q24_02416 [Wallemia mellicola]TIB73847.1 hypothetical protein E3Q23_02867 [Wallemia mellicola]TIB78119.1 hypothetical protein E3Q22_02752 [Wallemia mellicola]TIB83592.1 hypothetical protein E3Q21_02812 [Wallemia mellicola]TIB86541.1 hypothetical protein E3Q20_02804 [Wallemia mellicola]